MRVRIVPCLSDNYCYFLTCDVTGETAIIDASEAGPVLDVAKTLAKKPSAIWSTHHHFDHVGGNEAIRARAHTEYGATTYDPDGCPDCGKPLEEEPLEVVKDEG